jgi:hypothetical protein
MNREKKFSTNQVLTFVNRCAQKTDTLKTCAGQPQGILRGTMDAPFVLLEHVVTIEADADGMKAVMNPLSLTKHLDFFPDSSEALTRLSSPR